MENQSKYLPSDLKKTALVTVICLLILAAFYFNLIKFF